MVYSTYKRSKSCLVVRWNKKKNEFPIGVRGFVRVWVLQTLDVTEGVDDPYDPDHDVHLVSFLECLGEDINKSTSQQVNK